MRNTASKSAGPLLTALLTCGIGGCDDTDRDATTSTSAGGAGGSPMHVDAGVTDCLLECPPRELRCGPDTFLRQPTLQQTREKWRADCPDSGPDRFPFVAEGRCEDGRSFLLTGHGLDLERRDFNDAGALVGITLEVDFIDPVCQGRHYWPAPAPCDPAIVTTLICGHAFEPGPTRLH